MKGLDYEESPREPPEKLVNDLNQGKTILFLGSNFLEPPRYQVLRPMMSLIDVERSIQKASEVSTFANFAKSIRKDYSNLKSFCDETWPVEKYDGLVQLIKRFPRIKSIITTLFDTNVKKALRKTKRNITEITGVERVADDSFMLPETTGSPDSNIVLYQLLGSLDKPNTLRLTDDSLYELRKQYRKSLGYKFLDTHLKDLTLLLLGYEYRDMFDNFFRELINDLSYDKKTRNDFYFVDNLGYDTYYGLWANEEIEADNVIAMSTSSFIKRVI